MNIPFFRQEKDGFLFEQSKTCRWIRVWEHPFFFPEVSKSLVHVSIENYDFGDPPPRFKKPTNIDYRFFIRQNKWHL